MVALEGKFETTIHVERARRRMTQKELAEKVGVSRLTIIKIEQNSYNPSLRLAHDIADVFELPIAAIFKKKKLEEKNE